ncbi:Origin recognition complex subunit 5 [Stylosanthes scabra]|uniref:Origin recognition complex subunit 5 n=1 Tax=Stylosanthes scabra TaxID=79078 RepID=A0ABU6SCS1_9FABA|nr:Origin recognition complex subunit 5 [Stylosanthes scabra]
MKRKLFSHINPHITSSLNEIFKVSSHLSAEVENSKETKQKVNQRKLERREETGKLDFHMSTSAKPSEKVPERKESLEEELLMKGPGSFPLERLLAIFQCIVSVAEDPSDEDEQNGIGLGVEGGNGGLMSDVLLQLSSLCNAKFIFKGRNCPIEGSVRYRSTISEDLVLKVARSLKFPLSSYLYKKPSNLLTLVLLLHKSW